MLKYYPHFSKVINLYPPMHSHTTPPAHIYIATPHTRLHGVDIWERDKLIKYRMSMYYLKLPGVLKCFNLITMPLIVIINEFDLMCDVRGDCSHEFHHYVVLSAQDIYTRTHDSVCVSINMMTDVPRVAGLQWHYGHMGANCWYSQNQPVANIFWSITTYKLNVLQPIVNICFDLVT